MKIWHISAVLMHRRCVLAEILNDTTRVAAFLHGRPYMPFVSWYPSRMNHSNDILGSVVLRYSQILEIKAFLFGDDHQLPQKVILPVEALNF